MHQEVSIDRIRVALTIATSLVVLTSVPANALTLNPFSIIKGIVEAAVEDRGSSNITKDLKINAKTPANVIDKLGSEVISISADVYEQDVELTSAVENPEIKAKAGLPAASVADLKKVYNEILVTANVSICVGVILKTGLERQCSARCSHA